MVNRVFRMFLFMIGVTTSSCIAWLIVATYSRDVTNYSYVALNFIKDLADNVSRYGEPANVPIAASSISAPIAPLKALTFWTSDEHDGCRIDTPSVLVHLGQRVIVNSQKLRIGPYPHVFNRFIIPDSRSPILQSHVAPSDYLSEADIRANFQHYRNDPLLEGTDAFICSFPASLCELWMPFNKSIIFLPAHRFSLGRCSKAKFERLIEHVIAMSKHESPKHFVVAASVYDAEYINFYTGLRPVVLTSSSFFYAGHGVTNYTHTKGEILVGPLQRGAVFMEAELKRAAAKFSVNQRWVFISAKQRYGYYKLQNIADHRAVVWFPYAVMSFGITELYAMGIPIFVPSIEMLLKYGLVGDRTLVDDFYCGKVMTTQLPPKHPDSAHPYSPDSYGEAAQRYWLKFADYYQWPHITVFNDFGDLILKLEQTDFDEIHQKMIQENEKREHELLNRWRLIINQVDQGRKVPRFYNDAIKALWNTTQLQVE